MASYQQLGLNPLQKIGARTDKNMSPLFGKKKEEKPKEAKAKAKAAKEAKAKAKAAKEAKAATTT